LLLLYLKLMCAGRKIRYDVHAKLVNFMAPDESAAAPTDSRTDLFSSLFQA